MNPVCSDLANDTSPVNPFLLPNEFRQHLMSLQSMLAGIQNQIGYGLQMSPSSTTGYVDSTYLIRTTQNNVSAISEIRTEVSAIKAKLQHLTTPTTLCTGPMALATCLLAISLVAIGVIVLSSLGLVGILPQVGAILVSTSNAIWTIVSASIIAVICLISVLCVTLIRHYKPTVIEELSPKF